MPEEPDRNELVAAIVTEIAQYSPEAAARIVAEEMTPGPTQHLAAIDLATQWARTNPEQAAAWVAAFPEEHGVRDSALQAVVSAWSSDDPEAAGQWLASFADTLSEGRSPRVLLSDTLIGDFINQISPTHADIALGIVDKIADASTRQVHLENIVRHWLRLQLFLGLFPVKLHNH